MIHVNYVLYDHQKIVKFVVPSCFDEEKLDYNLFIPCINLIV